MATSSSSNRSPKSPFSSSSSAKTDAETLRRNRILSSKLYFHVPPSKVPLIYSTSYDIAFLGIEKLHPFDSSKWGRICQFLMTEGILDKNQIVEPLEASQEDLLVVHSESYLDSLKSSLKVSIIIQVNIAEGAASEKTSYRVIASARAIVFRVPPLVLLPNCLVQQKVLHPFRKQVGGTILAGKLAKEQGWAINVGGGFHHCSGERGGGFCTYADISLCIHYAFVRLNISRVMIIDLDAHQGNGHEMDFAEDRRVYILDMFNTEVYPQDFEARRYIDQTVELVSGTSTDEYLEKLDEALKVAEHKFDPELVVYNAGTDILDGDPLGGLKVSPSGVISRDEKVFRFAKEKNVPLVMLTSGGYMKSSAKVIADSIVNLSKKSLIDLDSGVCSK